MAIKNLVPRNDKEGKLGVESKKWKEVHAETGSFERIEGTFSLSTGSITGESGSFGVLKVTGDTATAQTMDDNSAGLLVYFTLDNTPNFDIDATEQDWTTSVLIGSENNVNFFDNTSNELYITGCQLEVGDAPSDFEFVPHDVQLQRCKRYFENYAVENGSAIFGLSFNANDATCRLEYKVTKRAAPTIGGIPTGVSGGNGFNFLTNAGSYTSAGSLASHSISIDGCRINGASHASLNNPGSTMLYATQDQNITIDAEL